MARRPGLHFDLGQRLVAFLTDRVALGQHAGGHCRSLLSLVQRLREPVELNQAFRHVEASPAPRPGGQM